MNNEIKKEILGLRERSLDLKDRNDSIMQQIKKLDIDYARADQQGKIAMSIGQQSEKYRLIKIMMSNEAKRAVIAKRLQELGITVGVLIEYGLLA